MVREGPARPAVRRGGEERLDLLAEVLGSEDWAEHVERIGHMQTLVPGVLRHESDALVTVADFADQHAIAVLIHEPAHPFQEGDVFRLVF